MSPQTMDGKALTLPWCRLVFVCFLHGNVQCFFSGLTWLTSTDNYTAWKCTQCKYLSGGGWFGTHPWRSIEGWLTNVSGRLVGWMDAERQKRGGPLKKSCNAGGGCSSQNILLLCRASNIGSDPHKELHGRDLRDLCFVSIRVFVQTAPTSVSQECFSVKWALTVEQRRPVQ